MSQTPKQKVIESKTLFWKTGIEKH